MHFYVKLWKGYIDKEDSKEKKVNSSKLYIVYTYSGYRNDNGCSRNFIFSLFSDVYTKI